LFFGLVQSFSSVLSSLECSETSSVHLLNCSEFSCQFRAFLAGSEHVPSDSKHFLVGSELILAKFNDFSVVGGIDDKVFIFNLP
jgi:hypothetical protein